MSTRTASILASSAIVVGLLATGCSTSTSHSAAKQSDKVTEVTTETTVEVTTTTTTPPTVTTVHHVTPTTHAPAPAPTPTPAETPAPTPTLGDPPVSVPTFITLAPLDVGLLLLPRVVTLTGQTHFTCLQAALAGYSVDITYTTTNATASRVLIDGFLYAGSQPASQTIAIPLYCGDSQTVQVDALWPDGTVGGSKTILIKVDPYF